MEGILVSSVLIGGVDASVRTQAGAQCWPILACRKPYHLPHRTSDHGPRTWGSGFAAIAEAKRI
jgi:hypothetical protein